MFHRFINIPTRMRAIDTYHDKNMSLLIIRWSGQLVVSVVGGMGSSTIANKNTIWLIINLNINFGFKQKNKIKQEDKEVDKFFNSSIYFALCIHKEKRKRQNAVLAMNYPVELKRVSWYRAFLPQVWSYCESCLDTIRYLISWGQYLYWINFLLYIHGLSHLPCQICMLKA